MAQLFRAERTWQERGETKRQVRYGVTSLPPAIGPPQRLLPLKRRHWLIENQGHRSKDVNLGEDASLLHAGHGPVIVATLRDVALSVLRSAGCFTIAARLRPYGQYPEQAVSLITTPLPTRDSRIGPTSGTQGDRERDPDGIVEVETHEDHARLGRSVQIILTSVRPTLTPPPPSLPGDTPGRGGIRHWLPGSRSGRDDGASR